MYKEQTFWFFLMKEGAVMTIEEMRQKKAEQGWTNRELSRESGVPLGTLQKIFSGFIET